MLLPTRIIQEGIEDGSIAPCDPKLATFAIAGAVNWISMWYEPEGPLSPEEIASEFARTLTQGIACRKRRGKAAPATHMESLS